MDIDRILTVEDVAAILQVKAITVREMFREKRLRGFKVGKSWRTTRAMIEEDLEAISRGETPSALPDPPGKKPGRPRKRKPEEPQTSPGEPEKVVPAAAPAPENEAAAPAPAAEPDAAAPVRKPRKRKTEGDDPDTQGLLF